MAHYLPLLWLATLPLLASAGQPSCELSDCLTRINAHVPVTIVSLAPEDLAGSWSRGGGLSGDHLYLFDDQSYIYTEWADVLPETIYDKGTWRLVEGVVTLSSDADVTWRHPGREGRFLPFRINSSDERLLLGLDFSLAIFESLARETPGSAPSYLRIASQALDHRWKSGEAAREKAQLLKECWRPEYFAERE